MNWFSKAVSKLLNGIKSLFTDPAAQKRALAALEQAGAIATQVYPLVVEVAKLTPNRTDDEIVSCINAFGLMGLVDPANSDKTGTLHNIVLTVAQRLIPGVPSSVVSLGIETAYQALKANATPQAK